MGEESGPRKEPSNYRIIGPCAKYVAKGGFTGTRYLGNAVPYRVLWSFSCQLFVDPSKSKTATNISRHGGSSDRH